MVRHPAGSYAVIVRSGAQADLAALLAERHPGARPVVITDTNVAAALGSPLPAAPLFTFPAGEAHKTRATWSDLTDRLLAARYDRHSVVVAFGGGVTTDLAGFVAATLMRGVPWIAVPTTTLAMLDAAVGGKTGVDTDAGKNLVGAFHPPSAVLCDPAVLHTLPQRSYREGMAEAVKHAATLDRHYGTWIGDNAGAIAARDGTTLEALIRRSVELKADVVAEDERESDRRAVLNAGHTVAHALERVSEFAIPHGEAVAIGLVVETRVAERMGVARAGTADEIAAVLAALELPTRPPPLDRDRLLDAMLADKKNRAGIVRAALVASFGTMARDGQAWTHPLDLNALTELL
ncbi:MAG: 3-dehydroquinate synthase [Gemmatimonadales bacterium]